MQNGNIEVSVFREYWDGVFDSVPRRLKGLGIGGEYVFCRDHAYSFEHETCALIARGG
jgi:hypothetical protein